MNKIHPDIWLAGAPKSGTTTLFNLLAQHPKICPSTPKEPFFFVDRDNPYRTKKEDYDSFFNKCEGDFLKLDGTSQSIYQDSILIDLAEEKPNSKAIFVLREPASRIRSSFYFTSNNLAAVKNLTFPQYAEILLSADVKRLLNYCKDKRAFFSLSHELSYSNYIQYLLAWRNTIGIESMLILLFEDLKNDPLSVFEVVIRFLEIEPFEPLIEDVKSNETQRIRNKTVHYFFQNLYAKLGYNIPFKSTLRNIYINLQQNNESSNSDNEDIEALMNLRQYFQKANFQLARQFNLDLRNWS